MKRLLLLRHAKAVPATEPLADVDRPLAELSGAKRKLLVAEAYGGKFLGGIGSLLTFPFRLLPWFKKKRVTDTYLADPHITGYQLPAPGADRAEVDSAA